MPSCRENFASSYDLVQYLYLKACSIGYDRIDSSIVNILYKNGVITLDEAAFDIDRWILHEMNEFYHHRLTLNKIRILCDINILDSSKKFTEQDLIIYKKFCSEVETFDSYRMSHDEELKLLDEIREGCNVNRNVERIFYARFYLIKKYIDLNYFYIEGQEYDLDDYISACIEGLLFGIRHYNSDTNYLVFLQRQMNNAVTRNCKIDVLKENIEDYAITERFMFKNIINADLGLDFTEMFSQLFYEDFSGVGKRNVYNDFLDCLGDTSVDDVNSVIEIISNKYHISDDKNLYKNCIDIIYNNACDYIFSRHSFSNDDRSILKGIIYNFLFYPSKRCEIVSKNMMMEKIKEILYGDVRDYISYLKPSFNSALLKRIKAVNRLIFYNNENCKVMYCYMLLTKDEQLIVNDIIAGMIERNDYHFDSEGLAPNVIQFLSYSQLLKLDRLEFLISCYNDSNIKMNFSYISNEGHRINLSRYKDGIIDYLNTLDFNITKNDAGYRLVEGAINHNSSMSKIIDILMEEQESMFDYIREAFFKYSSHNLIEVLNIYYSVFDVAKRNAILRKMGINTARYAIGKAKFLFSCKKGDNLLSESMFLSDEKCYFKYKK